MDAAEFAKQLREGVMRLALVGMSNAGKTKLSRALASAFSFAHSEVDGGIRDELGLADMGALAEWLGLPADDGYQERERRYLELEEKHTTREWPSGGAVVLDTTGSVAHLPPAAHRKLQERYFVVHLDVGEESLERLVAKYFAKPKPVVWGPHFLRAAGEPIRDALARSYPGLLAARLAKYRELAHVNVPVADVESAFGAAFLTSVQSRL